MDVDAARRQQRQRAAAEHGFIIGMGDEAEEGWHRGSAFIDPTPARRRRPAGGPAGLHPAGLAGAHAAGQGRGQERLDVVAAAARRQRANVLARARAGRRRRAHHVGPARQLLGQRPALDLDGRRAAARRCAGSARSPPGPAPGRLDGGHHAFQPLAITSRGPPRNGRRKTAADWAEHVQAVAGREAGIGMGRRARKSRAPLPRGGMVKDGTRRKGWPGRLRAPGRLARRGARVGAGARQPDRPAGAGDFGNLRAQIGARRGIVA